MDNFIKSCWRSTCAGRAEVPVLDIGKPDCDPSGPACAPNRQLPFNKNLTSVKQANFLCVMSFAASRTTSCYLLHHFLEIISSNCKETFSMFSADLQNRPLSSETLECRSASTAQGSAAREYFTNFLAGCLIQSSILSCPVVNK